VSTNPPGEDRGRFSRRIDDAFESASKLAGSSLTPADFFQQLLAKALEAIAAPAGAVWLRTPQGFLQVACQVNLEAVGLDDKRGGRQCHNEVLRQIFQANPPRPMLLEPQGRLSGVSPEPGAVPAANLTDFYAMFAPIVDREQKPLGLLEVFQTADHDPRMYQMFLQYTLQMAGYASQYHSFAGTRQNAVVEKTFVQVESFARLVHSSLNPTECAYHVANEGRRLVECDRMCVAVRHGRKSTVEAVSGADVVEKASTHVRRMKKLFDAVLKFNDKLVFNGERDDALPPDVLRALDEYLAESQPKLLVVQPIRDDREKDEKQMARSIVLIECFNPPENVEPIISRLELVGKHAAPALYNAAELKKIPFKWLWRPIVAVQEGLGGKARAIVIGVIALIVTIAIIMALVPYQLKLDAKGQFLPEKVQHIYAPKEGEIQDILLQPGEDVRPGQAAVRIYSPMFMQEMVKLDTEISTEKQKFDAIRLQIAQNQNKGQPSNELEMQNQLATSKANWEAKTKLKDQFAALYFMEPNNLGFFQARVPKLPDDVPTNLRWRVLNSDNRNELNRKTVRQSEPLLRLGLVEGNWRAELKIPQRNIGHIARAFAVEGHHLVEQVENPLQPGKMKQRRYVPVDILFSGSPDTSYPGRLYEDQLAAEAVPNRDDHNESEPIVIAYVQVDVSSANAAEQKSLFVAGQEVRVKVKCGKRAMGYSLFHGVWEWFYEKVIFFF